MVILIGIDESPESQAAVRFVCQMQWPKGSRAVVASAIHPVMAVYASEAQVAQAPNAEAFDREQRTAREEEVARVEQLLRQGGLQTKGRVQQGDPRDVLVALARSEAVDLIVVGSHGRTGLTKLMMGSVSSHVVTHAPCSVLVARGIL